MQSPSTTITDDPRKIREHLLRTRELARAHELPCVIVGMAAADTEHLARELFDYVESALRVEDAIFRMTRERAILFLADVDRGQAERIVGRLLGGFQDRFPMIEEPEIDLAYYEVDPDAGELLPKDVLLRIFPG